MLRTFLRSSVVVGLMLLAFQANAQPRKLDVNPLTVVGSESPQFDALVDTYFGGVRDLEGYQSWRRYLAVLTTTEPLVKAYTIRWDRNSDSSTSSPLAYRSYLHRVTFAKMERAAVTSKGPLLASPFFTLDSGQFRVELVKAQVSVLNALPDSSSPLRISVDLAVLQNGDFYGPNTLGTYSRYINQRNADHDVALELLPLVSSGSVFGDPLIRSKIESMSRNDRESLKHGARANDKLRDTKNRREYLRARLESESAYRRLLGSRSGIALKDLVQNAVKSTPDAGFSPTRATLSSGQDGQ